MFLLFEETQVHYGDCSIMNLGLFSTVEAAKEWLFKNRDLSQYRPHTFCMSWGRVEKSETHRYEIEEVEVLG